eukprot:gnl/Spiro4/12419_TR6559_c0_g1_i1.p1 gnl/Spiro4/12419_TR6559_c0_g1~~gnl/Spiro4/12419_TR6559_c0_g1_i1.p1  ORF type:complete len:414 (+),score=72.89 gnl/Spiro4/12419_TR6559_c0_g1_i1:32-1243(+)
MTSSVIDEKGVYIIGAARTPIGCLGGSLSTVPATTLGARAIQGAVERAHIDSSAVQEVYMGCVLSANAGQAPARQAALAAGLAPTVVATTVNKVCASGMKAIILAAQSLSLGIVDCAAAGGMESMSMCPYYIPKARSGYRYGHGELLDGVIKDGLWDPYMDIPMGEIAEKCAAKMSIARAAQDDHACEGDTRARAAAAAGHFSREIVPIVVPGARGDTRVELDEALLREPNPARLRTLRPCFIPADKGGSVTAGNASGISDGAAAVVLMVGSMVRERGLTPIARIVSYADAAQEPENFPTTPSIALRLALQRANLSLEQIDIFEINQAFSVVSLANMQLLGLDPARVDVHGGAVSLGHPLGASGARIVVSLCTALSVRGVRYGAAAVCNGGGGASALIVERFQ